MFNSSIKQYHKSFCSHHFQAEEALSKLNLKGDEKILDIGCGDGKISAKIASYVPRGMVLGIDNLESIIEFAKQKFPIHSYPNLRFQKGDANNLQFQDEFDIVVSFGCLHIIVNHLPVLQEIYKVLRDSGRVILQFHGKETYRGISTVIQDLIQEDKWNNQFKPYNVVYGFYTLEEYKKFLKESNLVTEKIDLYETEITYKGKEELLKSIQNTWLSLSSRIPSHLYQNFINEVVEKYVEVNPPDREGFIKLQEITLEIQAKK